MARVVILPGVGISTDTKDTHILPGGGTFTETFTAPQNMEPTGKSSDLLFGSPILNLKQLSLKRQIVNNLVSNLARIDGLIDEVPGALHSPYTYHHTVQSGNISRQFKYLDEINDFPYICLYAQTDRRQHIGAGVKYCSFLTTIRGYLKSGETVIEDLDDLIEDIEYVLESMICTLNLEEIRVLSVETDEGLFIPYGLCDLTVEIIFEQYDNV